MQKPAKQKKKKEAGVARKEAERAAQSKKELEDKLAKQQHIIAMFEQRDAERRLKFEEEEKKKKERELEAWRANDEGEISAEEEEEEVEEPPRLGTSLRPKSPQPKGQQRPARSHSQSEKGQQMSLKAKKRLERAKEEEFDQILKQFATRGQGPDDEEGKEDSKQGMSTKESRKAKRKELQQEKAKAKEDKADSDIEKMVKQAQHRKLRDQWRTLQDMFSGDHANKDPKQFQQHLEKIFALANTVQGKDGALGEWCE